MGKGYTMDKVYDLINEQINKEFFSAYLYMAIADYYEEAGLDGFANWYMLQAQEERDHALIFRNYMHANGKKITLGAIEAPEVHFEDFTAPLEAALAHEEYITASINTIYEAAVEAKDYRTQQFLVWFIDEQMEEEENANAMIDNMRLFGGSDNGLYTLNKEYATRTYHVASKLAE